MELPHLERVEGIGTSTNDMTPSTFPIDDQTTGGVFGVLNKLSSLYNKYVLPHTQSALGPVMGTPPSGENAGFELPSLPHTWGGVALQALPLVIGMAAGMKAGMKDGEPPMSKNFQIGDHNGDSEPITWVHKENPDIFIDKESSTSPGTSKPQDAYFVKELGPDGKEIYHDGLDTLDEAMNSAHTLAITKKQLPTSPTNKEVKPWVPKPLSKTPPDLSQFIPDWAKSPLEPGDPRENYTSLPGYKESRTPNRPIESYMKTPPTASSKLPIKSEDTSLHTIINSRDSLYHATTVEGFNGIMNDGVIRPGYAGGVSTSRVPKIQTKDSSISFVIDKDLAPSSSPIAEDEYKKVDYYKGNKQNPRFEFENRTNDYKAKIPLSSVKGIIVDRNQLRNELGVAYDSERGDFRIHEKLSELQQKAQERGLPFKVVNNAGEAARYRATFSKLPSSSPIYGIAGGVLGVDAWKKYRDTMDRSKQ